MRERISLRALGLNPRALGTNPKALGVNPKALGISPKQLRAKARAERRALRASMPTPEPAADDGRKPLPKWLRFAIFKRDGFKCTYCGAGPKQSRLQVDHIHPWSKGGTDDPSNLTTACTDCNGGKAAKLLSDREL